MAPSAIVSLRFGTTRPGSSSICTPRPVQVGHAPCGLLNEKLRGSISPTEYGACSVFGHAKCSLNVSSGRAGSPSPACGAKTRIPSPRRSACSTESAMRWRVAS